MTYSDWNAPSAKDIVARLEKVVQEFETRPKTPMAIMMTPDYYQKFINDPRIKKIQSGESSFPGIPTGIPTGIPVYQHKNLLENSRFFYDRDELRKFWELLEQNSIELLFATTFDDEGDAAIAPSKLGGMYNIPCYHISWTQDGQNFEANLIEQDKRWQWVKKSQSESPS